MSHRRVRLVLAGILAAVVGAGAEPDPEVAYAESALREANVATDGPSLLAFFRERTLSLEQQERLAEIVRQLGDNAFAVREKASRQLGDAGFAAVPFLRPAVFDADAEVARRAGLCLADIKHRAQSSLVGSAARLLAERQPPGAIETLLAYLPCADDEASEDAIFAALGRIDLPEGKLVPALAAALEDRNPLRRAAAAQFVGRAAGVPRRLADKLFADPCPRVRFEAARALARAGERQAVPVLIGLLGEGPVKLAWQVEELLGRLVGDQAPSAVLGDGLADRSRTRAAWAAWWQQHQASVDMARLQAGEPSLGLTLVCEFDGAGGGRVWEFGKDGRLRWQVPGLEGPNDVQLLPGGRILVAERHASRVTERDRNGKVLWQHKTVANPICCQRLASGHTLIATFSELLEVTPDHKKVFTHSHPLGFRHASRLRNGHTVYIASNGQVVELDADWKQLRAVTPEREARGAEYWASVQALPADRFLLALGGQNKVIEIDAAGKIVWECQLANAVHATRLPNGHTLVACFESRVVVEVDRAGKVVSRVALAGRPFTVRHY